MHMASVTESLADSSEIETLEKRIRMLEAVIDNFPGGLLMFDSENRLVFCNSQQLQLLDYPPEFFTMSNPSLEQIFRMNATRGEYGTGDVEEQVKARLSLVTQRCAHVFERTRPNGTVLEIRGVPLPEGGFVTSYVDITERRKHEALISHMAHHDQLTGLANRALMLDRLKIALAGAKRGFPIAVHYIDLDKFKPINDQYGHDIGDIVLKKSAATMLHSARETDTVARIGGDEFVIIQSDVDSISGAKVLADRILENIQKTIFVEDIDLAIDASIGIAFAPWDSDNGDELLRKADMAMYRSKSSGHGQITFFSNPSLLEKKLPAKSPVSHYLAKHVAIGDAAS